MNNNKQIINKKNNFFKQYKIEIIKIVCGILISLILVGIVYNPQHKDLLKIFCTIIGIALIVVGAFLSIISLYRQTKIPLTKGEMEKLNIETPDQYIKFINKYLFLRPNEQIKRKIVFTAYLYLYDKDNDEEKEINLCNTFRFSKMPICKRNYKDIYNASNKVFITDQLNYVELVEKVFNQKNCSIIIF